MGVVLGHYNLYVRFCERLGLIPVSQDKCTIELIKATHLVLNSQYGVDTKRHNYKNNK